MPLRLLALILIVVIAAAGGTVWLGTVLATAAGIDAGAALLVGLPIVLGVALVLRVLQKRRP